MRDSLITVIEMREIKHKQTKAAIPQNTEALALFAEWISFVFLSFLLQQLRSWKGRPFFDDDEKMMREWFIQDDPVTKKDNLSVDKGKRDCLQVIQRKKGHQRMRMAVQSETLFSNICFPSNRRLTANGTYYVDVRVIKKQLMCN